MLKGFPPVARADARVLVLGSMPGARSLADQQYYAQPRNAFWPIMGKLFGAGPELGYEERLDLLGAQGIALWDVLARCHRAGSLDQRIELRSAITNDFRVFLGAHPGISHVFFNGQLAFRLFSQRVAPELTEKRLVLAALPSTSPALASLSLEAKLAEWQILRRAVAGGG